MAIATIADVPSDEENSLTPSRRTTTPTAVSSWQYHHNHHHRHQQQQVQPQGTPSRLVTKSTPEPPSSPLSLTQPRASWSTSTSTSPTLSAFTTKSSSPSSLLGGRRSKAPTLAEFLRISPTTSKSTHLLKNRTLAATTTTLAESATKTNLVVLNNAINSNSPKQTTSTAKSPPSPFCKAATRSTRTHRPVRRPTRPQPRATTTSTTSNRENTSIARVVDPSPPPPPPPTAVFRDNKAAKEPAATAAATTTTRPIHSNPKSKVRHQPIMSDRHKRQAIMRRHFGKSTSNSSDSAANDNSNDDDDDMPPTGMAQRSDEDERTAKTGETNKNMESSATKVATISNVELDATASTATVASDRSALHRRVDLPHKNAKRREEIINRMSAAKKRSSSSSFLAKPPVLSLSLQQPQPISTHSGSTSPTNNASYTGNQAMASHGTDVSRDGGRYHSKNRCEGHGASSVSSSASLSSSSSSSLAGADHAIVPKAPAYKTPLNTSAKIQRMADLRRSNSALKQELKQQHVAVGSASGSMIASDRSAGDEGSSSSSSSSSSSNSVGPGGSSGVAALDFTPIIKEGDDMPATIPDASWDAYKVYFSEFDNDQKRKTQQQDLVDMFEMNTWTMNADDSYMDDEYHHQDGFVTFSTSGSFGVGRGIDLNGNDDDDTMNLMSFDPVRAEAPPVLQSSPRRDTTKVQEQDADDDDPVERDRYGWPKMPEMTDPNSKDDDDDSAYPIIGTLDDGQELLGGFTALRVETAGLPSKEERIEKYVEEAAGDSSHDSDDDTNENEREEEEEIDVGYLSQNSGPDDDDDEDDLPGRGGVDAEYEVDRMMHHASSVEEVDQFCALIEQIPTARTTFDDAASTAARIASNQADLAESESALFVATFFDDDETLSSPAAAAAADQQTGAPQYMPVVMKKSTKPGLPPLILSSIVPPPPPPPPPPPGGKKKKRSSKNRSFTSSRAGAPMGLLAPPPEEKLRQWEASRRGGTSTSLMSAPTTSIISSSAAPNTKPKKVMPKLFIDTSCAGNNNDDTARDDGDDDQQHVAMSNTDLSGLDSFRSDLEDEDEQDNTST